MCEDRPISPPDSAGALQDASCSHDRRNVLRRKLRELVWRVDQTRLQLESDDRAIDDRTLAQFLDTSDLHPLMEAGR